MLDNYAEPLGRYLMSAIFLKSAYDKIIDFDGTTTLVSQKGIPLTGPAVMGAIAFESLGSLSLIFNYYPKLGSGLLIIFLAMATAIFHNPLQDPTQKQALMKNLAILGGLLHYYASYTGFSPAGI